MEADTSESVAPSRLHYRPHLDGLRTVAVFLVVAFHAGLGLVAGGFIGVDIFFVLSGFLVTQILIRDIVAVGHVRRRQFYARRARRILPAAILTLIGTAIAYSIVASPVEMLNVLDAFRAAFFYVANWYFIRQSTNYFATDLNTNPVLHFWSLAVEEQFYLFWPVLLGALYVITARFGRRRWWALHAVVIAAGAASAIAALQLASTNLDRAYYGTDTRAYQLFAGAALALTPQLLRVRSRSPRLPQFVSAIALAGLIVLATSLLHVGPITRGVITAVLVVILLAAIENSAQWAGQADPVVGTVYVPRPHLLRCVPLALAGHRDRSPGTSPLANRALRDQRSDRHRSCRTQFPYHRASDPCHASTRSLQDPGHRDRFRDEPPLWRPRHAGHSRFGWRLDLSSGRNARCIGS